MYFRFCMALARGVGYFVLNGVELNLFLAALAVPLALLVGGAGGAFMTATCIGAGSALTNGSLVPLALFVSWAAVATAFKINRYLSAAAVILCQVAVVYFFNLYRNAAVTALLMTFAGCACCCTIPNRAIKNSDSISDRTTTLILPAKSSTVCASIFRDGYSICRKYFCDATHFQQPYARSYAAGKGSLRHHAGSGYQRVHRLPQQK